jgi:hypothetical protein
MPFKMYDFQCGVCKGDDERAFIFEATVELNAEQILDPPTCPSCSGAVTRAPAMCGGYRINGSNAGSTRPKYSGSFKRRK